MNYIIENCLWADQCDCKAMPAQVCKLKQAVAYCDKEKNKNPLSDATTYIQMGKILMADEVFKILGVKQV